MSYKKHITLWLQSKSEPEQSNEAADQSDSVEKPVETEPQLPEPTIPEEKPIQQEEEKQEVVISDEKKVRFESFLVAH